MPQPKEERRKKVSDYSWFKLHWADLFVETAGMSDSEFRTMFKDGYKAWRANDLVSMPSFIRSCAEETLEANSHKVRKGTEGTVPVVLEQEVQYGTEPLSPLSYLSSLSSSFSSSLSSSGESAERGPQSGMASAFHEFLRSGPPKWLNYELQAHKEWANAVSEAGSGPIIEAARKYADYVAREPATAPEHVKRPDNWLRFGDWHTDWDKEVKNGSGRKFDSAVSSGTGSGVHRYADARTRERRAAEYGDGYIELTAPSLLDD